MQHWIKCSDRLPPAKYGIADGGIKPPFLSEDVAVYFEDIGADIANYDHEEKHWSLVNHQFRQPDCEPTHWLPLPEVQSTDA